MIWFNIGKEEGIRGDSHVETFLFPKIGQDSMLSGPIVEASIEAVHRVNSCDWTCTCLDTLFHNVLSLSMDNIRHRHGYIFFSVPICLLKRVFQVLEESIPVWA